MATTEVESRVRKFVESPLQMLIGGRWVDAATGRTFATIDPATEEQLATVPQAGTEDVHRAVAAARCAFAERSHWRRMSPSQRGRILHRSRLHRVEREEIFGPVVVAIPFDGPQDAAKMANDTQYGLGAGVFTRDLSKAMRTATLMRAGTVYVNTWNVFDAAIPFSGYKQSGWGREMGHEVLCNYLETKTVIADLGTSL